MAILFWRFQVWSWLKFVETKISPKLPVSICPFIILNSDSRMAWANGAGHGHLMAAAGRRVAGATATHIDVRDAPGNPAEKAVGNPREMAISHQERHRFVMKSMG